MEIRDYLLDERRVHMTNQERIKKYKEEHCSRCKNKTKNDCEIRVFQNGDVICTKCVYYEREN
jgi:formylmethanofuran dehydrogenase subunit E